MTKIETPVIKIIGRSEKVSLVELGFAKVPAKIDTGAKTSAIWATNIRETADGLAFSVFGPSSPLYTGERHVMKHFEKIVVASSMGEAQERYKVRFLLKIRGKKVRSSFTLADRSQQAYPILIGRNVLRGKFLVDVKTGKPDTKAERQRNDELQAKLNRDTA